MTKKKAEVEAKDAVGALAAELAAQAPPLSAMQTEKLRLLLGVTATHDSVDKRRHDVRRRGPPRRHNGAILVSRFDCHMTLQLRLLLRENEGPCTIRKFDAADEFAKRSWHHPLPSNARQDWVE